MVKDRSGADRPEQAALEDELDAGQRDRLAPRSQLHAEINLLADQLSGAVTGDFDFRVVVQSNDFTVQKLVLMTNFLLDTIRRALDEGEERRHALEAQLETIVQQRSTIEALTTPVLRVWDGVLVVPLVGELGPERTARAMERVLESVSAHGARAVILDVTGVPLLTERAAEDLVRIAAAVRLLGARCLLTGVRAAVAEALASGAADLSGVDLQRDLHGALRACLP